MVKFFHVARSYGGREVLVDVTLTVGNGEAVVVSGSGGAGKSTLVRLLLGLEKPSRGWITVDGLVVGGSPPDVLAAHRRRVAWIGQVPALVRRRDVAGNVALAAEVAGTPPRAAREAALRTLERLDLGAWSDRDVASLSASERRWVAIARALVRSEASVLVADEPGADLDLAGMRRLGALLEEERELNKSVIVLTRLPEVVGFRSNRVAFLDGGRISLEARGSFAALPMRRAL